MEIETARALVSSAEVARKALRGPEGDATLGHVEAAGRAMSTQDGVAFARSRGRAGAPAA